MGGVTSILFLYVVEHLEMISIPNQSTAIPCCIICYVCHSRVPVGCFQGRGHKERLICLPLNKGIFP